MGINVRTKGAGGEREIADDLNYIVYSLMKELGMDNPTMQSIQRNQNQTAVGGADLTGTFGLAIEVKRQETLSVNTWWAQCLASANKRNEIPVLLYRQNQKKWKCVLGISVPVDATANLMARGEVDYDTFKNMFQLRARRMLLDGSYEVKV
jgi:hypothetical protein